MCECIEVYEFIFSIIIIVCLFVCLGELYGDVDFVEERHRHRYEVYFPISFCFFINSEKNVN